MSNTFRLQGKQNRGLEKLPLMLLLLGSVTSTESYSHSLFEHEAGTELSAALYTSYRSKGNADDQLWQVPGTLMGGESYGSEKGFALEDATLSLAHSGEEGWYDERLGGLIELGSHAHGGDTEVELEQALIAINLPWDTESLALSSLLEVGKRKPAFNASLASHPRQRAFTDQALMHQIFFGGHYSDTGIHAQLKHVSDSGTSTAVGLEVWDGAQFPGSAEGNDISFDVYLRQTLSSQNFDTSVSLWHFQSKASNRGDDRLNSDHSHGGANLNTNASDIAFFGDTKLSGADLHVTWRASEHYTLAFKQSYAYKQEQGELRDTSRIAALDAEHHALSSELALTRKKHRLAIRYEHLKLDNHLTGAGAEVLGQDAGLVAMNDNPTRLAAAYRFTPYQALFCQLEWQQDRTTERDINAMVLSLSWASNWRL